MNVASSGHYILFIVYGTTYGLPSAVVAHVAMVDPVTAVAIAATCVDGGSCSRGPYCGWAAAGAAMARARTARLGAIRMAGSCFLSPG